MTHKTLTLAIFAALLISSACSDDQKTTANDTSPSSMDSGIEDEVDAPLPEDSGVDVAEDNDAAVDAILTTPVVEPECTDNRRPIVAAHGFLASGDTYTNHAMRFAANGYCLRSFYAFDWNSLDQGGVSAVDTLDTFIDAVLAESGATQVDLAGHSAGGGLGYQYLADPTRASKVAHYAHIGSNAAEGPAGPEDAPTPTLNLWSQNDLIIADRGDIEGANNVRLTVEDHYSVATSDASFEAIFTFFNDGEVPSPVDLSDPLETVFVSGKALSLGENTPVREGTVEIFEVESATGARQDPIARFQTDANGHWGPFIASPDKHYEFKVQEDALDSIPVHYYREPFTRSNHLVYLRTLPSPDSFAGLVFSGIPFNEDTAVMIVFIASRALNENVDSLTVNGFELATTQLASPDQTTIALFLYDGNSNGESDETVDSLFSSFPFLNAFDLAFPAGEDNTLSVNLNGRILNVPAWPAASDGATITVFN